MKRLILILACTTLLSSCSVMMAAKKEGVPLNHVQSCQTRAQLLATGVNLIDSCRLESGELMETYQVQKEKGSASRAFMHGLLDVSTCGLWEVVGTPIEAYSDQREYYFIRVIYDQNEVIRRIELN